MMQATYSLFWVNKRTEMRYFVVTRIGRIPAQSRIRSKYAAFFCKNRHAMAAIIMMKKHINKEK